MRRAMLGDVVIDLDRFTESEISQLQRRNDYICVTCKMPVIFKNGTRKRAHFSHVNEGISVSNPESAEHILVKHCIAKWLKGQGINAIVERRFPIIDRIADVYFEYKDAKYVVEIQKSPMSDSEFKQRVLDYKSIDATVLWVFLGEVEKKGNTYKLPAVMIGRGLGRLFHFCVKTAKLNIFADPVFVSTRKVFAKPASGSLCDFCVVDLLCDNRGVVYFDKSWFVVKEYFRKQGWYYVTKSEKKLLEQCLIRGFNLSLLPTEVGWPVDGDAMGKHLFVWQAYVVLVVMKHFNVGDVFSINHMFRLLKVEYQVVQCARVKKQVLSYLKWLVMFGVIKEDRGYITYVKVPKICANTENQLRLDRKFIEVVANLW